MLFILRIPAFCKAKSNILLITIDTLRYDRLSIHNKQFVQTPNLDEIAGQGVIFTRAFAHTPLTLPSHANILTGATPLYHGISDNNRFKLNERFLTLAEYLKPLGYQTAAFVGSFVLSRCFGLNQGFDTYYEPIKKDTFIAEEVITPVINWLEQQNKKWFCWVHLWDPHTPYSPPLPFKEEYSNDLYSGEVAYVDKQLGRLFEFLEKKQLMGNTLVIITGDHGESLEEHGEYDHGFFAYNSTIHIPLIVYYKQVPVKKINANVSHSDIFPLVCDFLEQDKPAHLQKSVLFPLIKGEKIKNQAIYIESKAPFHSKGWAPLEGFIRKNQKFINLPIKELYNIQKDYDELHNIISSVKLSDLFNILNRLKKQLSGKFQASSKFQLSQRVKQKLRTFGYLSGFKQKKKKVYTREDDLKVLLPLQNRLIEARDLVKEAKYNQAISIYQKVIQERPGNIGSYIYLAEIYQKMNRPSLGVSILNQGLKQSPQNLEIKSRLGIILIEVNRIDDAILLLNQVLKKEDFNAENWNFLGVAYYRKGQFKKAIEAYQKCLKLDNKLASGYNNLGTLFLTLFQRQKKPQFHKQAIKNFKQALKLDPRQASAFNGLGAAYKLIGDRENAVQNWKNALEIKPEFTDVYFNLGITLFEMEKKVEALKYLLTCKNNYFDLLTTKDQKQLIRLIRAANQ